MAGVETTISPSEEGIETPRQNKAETLSQYKKEAKDPVLRKTLFEACKIFAEANNEAENVAFDIRLDFFGNIIERNAAHRSLLGWDLDHWKAWSKGGRTRKENLNVMHTHSNSLKRDESIESIEENWKKFRSGLRQRYYRRMCAYVRSKHAQNRKFNMTSLLKMLCKEPRTKRKFACFQESFADYLEREDTKSIETPLELENLDEARGWRLIEFISSIVGWGKRSNGAWKDDETRLFVTAVKKHGIGNWSRIVHDFEPGSYAHVYQYRGQRRARDAKQLKDKYRNLMKTGEWQTWETEIEREQDKDKDKNS